MKYMLMMHVGSDGGNDASWTPEDVKNMIEFQRAFDGELEDSGEMVFNAGLAWPDQARIVRYDDRAPAVSYWLEDVDIDGTRTLHGPIAPIAEYRKPGRVDRAFSLPSFVYTRVRSRPKRD